MKIFDTITFFRENFITNLRFEILDDVVDFFVVCESNFDHKGKKYEFIVVTDIFEVSSDIYEFVKFFKNILEKEGKILLTSINPKWNLLFKFFETIGISINEDCIELLQ